MKRKCKACARRRPLDCFYTSKCNGKVYHQRTCKVCVIQKNQRYYYENHEERKAWHRDHNRRSNQHTTGRKAQLREWLKGQKAKPCQDCGHRFPPECMDFDHRDPATKTRAVAAMIGAGQKQATIEAEIAKCDLICANCHRIRTARQMGWK